jgi:hypothetical protein
MWESADPERYLELDRQSRQTSSKRIARGPESTESTDGATVTNMLIFRSLTLQEQQWTPSSG